MPAIIGRCFSNATHQAIKWFKHYVYLTRAAFFLLGLVFAHGLVKNAVVDILMLYLIENWEQSNLPKAAAIVNIQEGVAAIVAIIVAHITDAYIGRFKMVIVTTVSFILGLTLLLRSTSISSEETVEILFYMALVLIALGTAGRDPPLIAFLADQLPGNDEEQIEDRTRFWWRVVKFVGAAISVFFIAEKSWKDTFMISTIVMGIAYLWFLSGVPFRLYNCKGPTGSPLTILYRVFKAALFNRHLDYPTMPTGYSMNAGQEMQFSPNHRILRWMDKAAIIESSSYSNREPIQNVSPLQKNICSIAEVKHAKRLLTLTPLWSTFLMYSLVQAAGATFFIEQTDGMDIRINNEFDFPVNFFFILKSLTSSIISFLINLLISRNWRLVTRQRAQLLRINIGMLLSILCCLVAWRIEVRRLKLMKEYGALSSQYQKNKIPMKVTSLIPQFMLLGVMEGFAEDGLAKFFYNHVDESMKLFETPFSGLVIGIGKFLIVFFILFRKSWFGDSINYSRLDKYFRLLMILSCCNLSFCGLVSYKYAGIQGRQQSAAEIIQNQQQQLQEQLQDDAKDHHDQQRRQEEVELSELL